MKPIQFVRDNNQAFFQYFRQGYFYFKVEDLDHNQPYLFQIPLADLGDATLNTVEKAIHLMRYIRKGLDDGTMVRI